jgi:diaminopimelate decarboxylase
MNHFEYRDGKLHCEGVDLAVVSRHAGTPVYVYSTATLERHLRLFGEALGAAGVADPLIAFAVKANSNLSVLRVLARQGAGADTVSEGEIRRALAAGVPASKIVVSGVGKTDRELAFALDAGVCQVNVETASELRRLAAIAAGRGVRAPIAIRVNPGVGAGAHEKITTGGAGDKFGVTAPEALALYAEAARTPSLAPLGLACHIGSQITDLAPLKAGFAILRGLVEDLRADGLEVTRLDLGGGLGVPYFDRSAPSDPPGLDDLAGAVADAVRGLDVEVILEPGRLIAANAGVLVTRVVALHPRPDGGPSFLVLDAGMNDLMRPTLYGAFHDIRPLTEDPARDVQLYDVVGPVCETGDTFARARLLPRLKEGELAAFMSAGAYGAVMANQYNSRPLVPEVLVRGEDWAVVRPRPGYEEMLEREPVAPWLR